MLLAHPDVGGLHGYLIDLVTLLVFSPVIQSSEEWVCWLFYSAFLTDRIVLCCYSWCFVSLNYCHIRRHPEWMIDILRSLKWAVYEFPEWNYDFDYTVWLSMFTLAISCSDWIEYDWKFIAALVSKELFIVWLNPQQYYFIHDNRQLSSIAPLLLSSLLKLIDTHF